MPRVNGEPVPVTEPAPMTVRAIVQRKVWKTSEVAAFSIVRDIAAKGLSDGDRLPLEAEMMDHYGVSRESLREALRLLEAQGMVTIRRGPGGGPIVGRAESANLARTMSLYFQLAGATYDELIQAWRVAEPISAEMAANNPDRDLVRAAMAPHLKEFDHGGDRDRYEEHANDLHFALGSLSGNRVLDLILRAVGDLVRTHVLLQLDPLSISEMIDDDHHEIAEAVVEGDGTRARELLIEHNTRLDPIYRSHWKGSLSDLVEWK